MTTPAEVPENGGSILSRITGNLMNEIFVFARYAGMIRQLAQRFSVERPGRWVMAGYAPRFSAIGQLIRITDAELRIRHTERIPYIYNGARWDVDQPAGYLGSPDDPSLDTVLTSFYALVGTLWGDSKLPKRRIYKATTYICMRQGYAAAVAYVLDLIEYGYIPDNDDAALCLTYILDENARKNPVAWARHRIRKIDELQTGSAWLDADIRGRVHARSKASAVYNEQVITRLLTLIEGARDSVDASEFQTRQQRLHRVASAFLALHRAARGQPALTLQTLMYDLEEMQADAIVIVDSCSNLKPGRSMFTLGAGVVRMAEHNQPGAGRRVEATRALAPRVLGEIPIGGFTEIPPEWDYIPAWLAIPLSVPKESDTYSLPGTDMRVSDGGEDGRVHMPFGVTSAQEAAELAELEAITASAETADRLSHAVQTFPWSGRLRVLLADSLIKAGRPNLGLEHAEAAIHLDLTSADAWQSLSDVLRLTGFPNEAAQTERVSRRLVPSPIQDGE